MCPIKHYSTAEKLAREATAIDPSVSFISLLHSDNQLTTKFYNSSKADVGGNVLTLTWCVLRSVRTESVWMPTDFPVPACPLRMREDLLSERSLTWKR